MPIASVPAFVSLLDQYGLVDPETRPQLTRLAQAGPKDPRAFAREVLQRGWLTPYQVNQLFQDNGDRLQLGSYTVLERLGSGGVGNVFKARHQKLGRVVAVKVIQRDKLDNPAIVHRFLREIRVAARLDHPNIVHAYDAEEVNGGRVLVMEYVEGTDLGRLVREAGPLPVREACDYVRQAALALQYASEKGLVHRDVKPGNLMLQTPAGPLAGPGTVKLLDLGLVLSQQPLLDGSAVAGPLTVAGRVVGSVDFIAPEQARDPSNVDIRADLYSLGCTFYYLLTGRAPFEGTTTTNKLLKHALDEPEPVERLRQDVPPAVAAVLRKMMAKRPEDRYQTPAAAAEALGDVLRGQAVRPRTAQRRKRAPRAALRTRPPMTPEQRRVVWLCVGLTALLLILLAVLAVVLAHYPDARTAS